MTLPSVDDVKIGSRFATGMVRLMRKPISAAEAHAVIAERLGHREANFLALARDAIYAKPGSPYERLLRHAGCEYGDLESLVAGEGLEGALQVLLGRGIYLTVAELRGQRPVVRGSLAFGLSTRDLRDPRITPQMMNRSSGSRGQSRAVPSSLSSVRDQAIYTFLTFEAAGGLDWDFGRWVVPGTTTIAGLTRFALWRANTTRWFAMVKSSDSGLHPRYSWSERAMTWAARLAGVSLPKPIHVPVHDPMAIVLWMDEVLRRGRTPCLITFVSAAVRVCQAALDAGISLHGAQFSIGGEPLTAGRVAVIRRAGAGIHLHYGTTETSAIGRSCQAPDGPDDMHFQHERLGLIQPGDDGPGGLPPQALLFTTLLPRARLILVNASLGDQADVTHRRCGCPLERLGWTVHLVGIRSFEKLTAGGMTFYDGEVTRALDEVLPAHHGGGPSDYQLVDVETEDGRPGIQLLVHPRLGIVDEAAVRETFLRAIGPGDSTERVMAQVWRDAGFPLVVREAPRLTASGRVHHVHLDLGRTPSGVGGRRP